MKQLTGALINGRKNKLLEGEERPLGAGGEGEGEGQESYLY